MPMPIYSSTKIGYRLDEAAGDPLDSIGTRHLTGESGGLPIASIFGGARARYKGTASQQAAARASDAELRGWLEGSWTWRVQVNFLNLWGASPGGARHLVNVGRNLEQGTVANRWLCILAFDNSIVVRTMQCFWTNSAGLVVYTSGSTSLNDFQNYVLTYRKTVALDLSCTVDLFVDKVLDGPSGHNPGLLNVGVGVGHGVNSDLRLGCFESNGADAMRGLFKNLYFDNVALTQAQIDESVDALAVGGGSDAVAPVVTWISPAPGSTITSSTRIRLSVTDAGGLRRTPLWIEYASGLVELVHDGTGFTSAFLGSTSTLITGGVEFSILRAGGWPTGSFTFRADPIDTSGNAL